MNFEISAETFVRLACVPRLIPKRVLDAIPDEDLKAIKCVRLEYRNGHYYAISTNKKTATIYYLGTTTNANAVVHVVVDDKLVKQCETEKPFNSVLSIISIPELQMTSIKTTLGYAFPGNAAIYPKRTPMDDWPNWVPKQPATASVGAMQWALDTLIALNKSSPSGKMIFPEFINAMEPVMIRDSEDANWLGVFMVNVIDERDMVKMVDGATLPDWWQK